MNAKLKPNGSVRILLDASSPRDDDPYVPGWIYSPDYPGSVNSTIDHREFPAVMSSVDKLVCSIWRVGRGH